MKLKMLTLGDFNMRSRISKNVNIEKVNTISLYEEISGDPIDVEQSDTKVNIPKCVIDPDTEKYYNCSNLN